MSSVNQISVAASNAHSIAESTTSQLNTKLRANQTKLKLKDLLRNVDKDKTGMVKDSAFFTMLKLHGVNLSQKDTDFVTKKFGNGDQIKYKEALGELTIDLVSAIDQEVVWVVNQP